MAKKYLYGNLNQDVVRANYGGSKTDSLTITVDNENMLISGDVNWDNAIGEIYGKAYPGDKGARNYQKIIELTAALNAEVELSSEHRSSTTSRVSLVEKQLKELDARLTTTIKDESDRSIEFDKNIVQQIISEARRALAAEEALKTNLEKEVATLKSDDAEIKTILDTLSGLSSESVITLREELETEIQRALDVEHEILERIKFNEGKSAEYSESVESQLQTISSELKNVDRLISTAISDEHSSRVEESTAIAVSLSEEISRSVSEDKNLQNLITSVKADVETIDHKVAQTATDVKGLTRLTSSLTTSDTNLQSQLTSVSAEQKQIQTELTNAIKTEQERAQIVESNLQNYITDTQSQLSRIQDQSNIIAERTAQLDNAVSKLTAANNVTLEQFESVLDTINSINDQVKDVEHLIKSETSRALDEESVLFLDIEGLKKSTVSIEQSLSSVKTSISQTDTKLVSFERDILDVESSIVLLKKDHQSLEETSNLKFEAISTNIQNLVVNNNSLTENIIDISNKLSSTQADVAELKVEQVRINSDTSNLESRFNSLQENFHQIEEQILVAETDLRNTINELLTFNDKTTTELQSISADVADLKDDVTNLEKSLSELDNLTKEQSVTISNIESDVRNTQLNVESISLQTNGNTNRIAEVERNFRNEINRSISTDENLNNTLDSHEILLSRQQTEIGSIQLSVETLKGTSNSLQSNIQNLSHTLDEETKLRSIQWESICKDIAAEVRRSLVMDEEHTSDIKRNSDRITSLQKDLTEIITEFVNKLKTEDEQLYKLIESEEESRNLLEARIRELILDTDTSSIYRDENLQSQINELKDTSSLVSVIPNDGTIEEGYVQRGTMTLTRPVDFLPTPDSIVKRDNVGNIILHNQEYSFTSNSAVSKKYVDTLIEDIEKKILSQFEDNFMYDFIDGGNAPIG